MDDTATGFYFVRSVKSFGGTQSLRGVSLKVGRGEIVALLASRQIITGMTADVVKG